jgi:hypothetical protein
MTHVKLYIALVGGVVRCRIKFSTKQEAYIYATRKDNAYVYGPYGVKSTYWVHTFETK